MYIQFSQQNDDDSVVENEPYQASVYSVHPAPNEDPEKGDPEAEKNEGIYPQIEARFAQSARFHVNFENGFKRLSGSFGTAHPHDNTLGCPKGLLCGSAPKGASEVLVWTSENGAIWEVSGCSRELRSFLGSKVLLSWDTEYTDPERAKPDYKPRTGVQKGDVNRILSYQVHFVCAHGFFSAIHFPRPDAKSKDRTKERRLRFKELIGQMIELAMQLRLISDWPVKGSHSKDPANILLVGHFNTADVPGFADKQSVFGKLDHVRRTLVSIQGIVSVSYRDRNHHSHELDVKVYDTKLLVPAKSQSLATVGRIVGNEKLEVSQEYKERMDLYLQDHPREFRDYALNDAVITAQYLLILLERNADENPGVALPMTLSSIAIQELLRCWHDSGINGNAVVGKVLKERRVPNKNGGYSKYQESVYLGIVEDLWGFAVKGYHGGRNESYIDGVTVYSSERLMLDKDFAGAYSTALATIGMPQWEASYNKCDLEGITYTTLGVAHVKFKFPSGTRFPCLPVRTDFGLNFPLEGVTYAGWPEILLAQQEGAEIHILSGFVVPQDFSVRPFAEFSRKVQRLRDKYKKVMRLHENDKEKKERAYLWEQFWKELGDSLYGKICQGLRERTVFSTRGKEYVRLPNSRITNPILASYITSFIRACLGEALCAIPDDVIVSNATTDGILSDLPESEIENIVCGPCCQIFADARELLGEGRQVLVIKRRSKQIVGWRVRGQLATDYLDWEDDPIIAKAGIKPLSLDKREQCCEIIDLLINRTYDTKLPMHRLSSIMEIQMKDSDLVGVETEKRVVMDWDWKRKPKPGYHDRELRGVPLIYFETEPWGTVDEFIARREAWHAWSSRHRRVLKTSVDLDDFLEAEWIRSSLPHDFRRGRLKDICVRLFLRLYTNTGGCLYTDAELAGLFKASGYLCSVRTIEHARASGMPERTQILPRENSTVKNFVSFVQSIFPAFDSSVILLPQTPEGEPQLTTEFTEAEAIVCAPMEEALG
jgi:hypothetical protein